MKILLSVLGVLLFLLQLQLWFGKGGLADRWSLYQKIEVQQLANEKQRDKNRRLKAEVSDLKAGHAAVEEHARSELGMIRQGETFYQVVLPAQVEEKLVTSGSNWR